MRLDHIPVSMQHATIEGSWTHRTYHYVEKLPLLVLGIKTYAPTYSLDVDEYDIYQVQLVQSGALTLQVGNRTVALTAGSGVIYRLGSAYHVSAERETRVLYASVLGDRRYIFSGEATWFTSDAMMDSIRDLLLESFDKDGALVSWLLASLAESMIAHATALAPQPRSWKHVPTFTNDMVSQAQVILGSNANSGLTPQDLLKTIGISYRHLARLFKEHTGRSPKRYQIEARIGSACRMLESGTMTVSEVASELGFSSPQYFARQFRQVKGQAPCDYLAECTRTRPQPDDDDTDRC